MSARASEERRRGLGYGRPPIPSARVLDLLAAGRREETALLLFLYARASWGAFQEGRVRYMPSGPFTLEEIGSGIGWLVGVPKGTAASRMKWLSKLLRRLWQDGDLRYDSAPGRKGHRYQVRLYPAGGAEAEDKTPGRRRTSAAESSSGSGIEPAAVSGQAEDESASGRRGVRRKGVSGRRTAQGAKSHEERLSAVLDGSPGGAPQTLREELSVKGGLPGLSPEDRPLADLMERARETAVRNGSSALGDSGFLALLHDRYRAGALTRSEWLGRVELHGLLWRARPADEEQLLGEVEALVAEGVLVPLDAEAGS